jgi:predicted MFS family arabinose efflux permease
MGAGVDEGRYRYGVAISLCVVYTFNFLDRQFLSILAEPVKHALLLTDTQLGLLTGLMFALFYTLFGIPVSALADRYNRVRIISIACGLWSAFTGACGLATGFASLAIARMGVGVGEAGGAAPSYSIISDYFPPEERGVGLAIFSLGVPIGTMLGAASGGWIAAHYGWRAAFLALGAVGLVLAPILPMVVREPIRGRLDPPRDHQPAASVFATIQVFVRSPTLVLTALSAGLTAILIYGLLSWMPAYLIREHGMSLSQIASYYSVTAGITIGIGTLAGGYVVDKWASRRPRLYALIPGSAALLAMPFMSGLAHAQTWRDTLLFMAGPYVLLNCYLAPALTVIQNGVAANQRAAAGAIFLLVLNIIGLGCGPLLIGMASDHFTQVYGTQGLRLALSCLAPVFLLVFLVQLAAAWSLRKS